MRDMHGYFIDVSDPVVFATDDGIVNIALRGNDGFYPYNEDGILSEEAVYLDTDDVISLHFGSLPARYLAAYVEFRNKYGEY